MNTIVEDLTAARQIISDRSRWTKGAYYRNPNGSAVESIEGDEDIREVACQWCAVGALAHVQELPVATTENSRAHHYLERAAKLVGARIGLHDTWIKPVNVNDEGHEPAIEMFDIAIEMAKEDRDASRI